MPLDQAPISDGCCPPQGPAIAPRLTVNETAYATELYNLLLPGANAAYKVYFYERTRRRWQAQMVALVEVTGAVDPLLPVHEIPYVKDWYDQLRPYAENAYYEYFGARTPADLWSLMLPLVYGSLQFEVVNYKSAVLAAGGAMTPTATTAYQNFVAAEKAAGCYQLTDDYWMLWGENTQQALISFKQRRAVVPVGNPTWIPSWGYQFDAATNYLNTGFIAASHRVAMTDSSVRGAAYIRGGQNTSSYAFGAQTGSARGIYIRPRTAASTMAGTASSNPGSWTVAGDDSRGLLSVQRDGPGAAEMIARRNGVSLPNTVAATTFGVLTVSPLFIGALCSGGAPVWSGVTGLQVGFVAVGAAFTPAQSAAHYTNVQNLILALGAS